MPQFVLQFIVKAFLVIDSDTNFPAVSRERTVFLLFSMFHHKVEKITVQKPVNISGFQWHGCTPGFDKVGQQNSRQVSHNSN